MKEEDKTKDLMQNEDLDILARTETVPKNVPKREENLYKTTAPRNIIDAIKARP